MAGARRPGPLGTDTNSGLIDPGTCARTHHQPPGSICATRPSETEIAHRRALAEQTHQVRLIIWGGAATPGDNSAFEFSARNVASDYRAKTKGNFSFVQQHIKVAKDIVSLINRQPQDSIRSLDIFTHGGPQALYLTTADADSNQILRYVLHNSSLYRSRARMYFNAAGWTEGSALIGDIDFARFTMNAKIELHGCATAAADSDTDNIAADFSVRLVQAGKRNTVVIGHADKANPNIKGGGEKNSEQDYRHGRRIVFHNGRILRATNQRGLISETELEGLVPGTRP